jgi:Icc-related predicted phosphoesterase
MSQITPGVERAVWGAMLRLLFVLGLASCSVAPAPTFSGVPRYAPDRHFTLIGDLQGTLSVEKWLMHREDNARERERLVPELSRSNPAFVVMLGDLVAWGASDDDWQQFDRHTAALRSAHIPVFAVAGNHDYFGGDRLRHYFARFPHLAQQRWYERRYGPLALLFVDSNAGALRAFEAERQKRWYEAALERCERDPSVLGVLVFLHHAPFTNSSLVTDDDDVRRTFVPGFVRSKKTLVLFSGHAHGYERFELGHKAFVVSAGGGGPRSPLNLDARHPDRFRGPERRNFNFVELSLSRAGLHADVIGLPKSSVVDHAPSFCHMESFDVPWPLGAQLPADLGAAPAASHPSLRDCYPRP